MRTQLQSIRSEGAGQRRLSRSRRAIYAAVVSCTFGLLAAAQTASSQTVDGGLTAVQPNTVRAAERHRAHVTGDALVGATVMPAPASGAPSQDSRPRAAAKAHSATHSNPMNLTARAQLETSRQVTGLPPLAMICEDCDFLPPCRLATGCSNSPIIEGAGIVVER